MSDTLSHEGKSGMRWGVQRYQNKDGTWTPLGLKMRRLREGKKRKQSGDAKKRADRKNEIKNLQSKAELDSARAAYKINKAQNKSAVQAAKAGAATIGNKIKDVTKKAVEAHKEKKREESVEDIVRSGDMNKILSSKTKLTEDELRTAVNRLRLEQDLKDVGAREKARGQEAFKKFSDTVANAAKGTTAAITTYNNVAQVMNSLFGKNMKKIGWSTNPNQSSNASNTQSSSHQQNSNSNQSSDNTSNTQSSSHQQSSNSSQSSSNSPSTQNSTSSQSSSSGWSPQRQAESQSRLNSAMTDLAHANALMTAARSRYGENSSQARQMEQLYRAANTVATAARTSHNEVVNSNPSVQAENRRQAIRDIANMPVQDAVHAVTHRASQLMFSRAAREAQRQQAEYEAQQAIQRLDAANNLLNNVNMDNWRRSMGLDEDYR
jgi:hypothetical protein